MPETINSLEGDTPSGAPVADTPTPTTPVGEPEPSETPPSPTPSEPAGNQDEADGDDALAIARYFEAQHGLKVSDKFKSDDAFLASVANLMRKVGERDEDAQAGRLYREHEREFQEYLAGKSAAKPQPQNTPEYNPAWRYQIVQDEKGEWKPAPGAPRDVVDKYRAWAEYLQDQQGRFFSNPSDYLDQVLADKLASAEMKIRQALQQDIGATAERAEVLAWGQTHKDLLHVGGQPGGDLSPLGKRVQAILENELAEMPLSTKKLDVAMRMAVGEQVKPPVPKKPKPQALHHPSAGSTPVKVKTFEERVRAGEDPAKIWEEQWRATMPG